MKKFMTLCDGRDYDGKYFTKGMVGDLLGYCDGMARIHLQFPDWDSMACISRNNLVQFCEDLDELVEQFQKGEITEEIYTQLLDLHPEWKEEVIGSQR